MFKSPTTCRLDLSGREPDTKNGDEKNSHGSFEQQCHFNTPSVSI
jgi:hypothetical protein